MFISRKKSYGGVLDPNEQRWVLCIRGKYSINAKISNQAMFKTWLLASKSHVIVMYGRFRFRYATVLKSTFSNGGLPVFRTCHGNIFHGTMTFLCWCRSQTGFLEIKQSDHGTERVSFCILCQTSTQASSRWRIHMAYQLSYLATHSRSLMSELPTMVKF